MRNLGNVVATVVVIAVLGGPIYGLYKRCRNSNVHPSTVVRLKAGPIEYSRVYEDGKLKKNEINTQARVTLPAGPFGVSAKEELVLVPSGGKTSIPIEKAFANRFIPQATWQSATALSAKAGFANYSRTYDTRLRLVGEGVTAGPFSYARGYDTRGHLKDETLGAGVTFVTGLVDVDVRRLWRFEKRQIMPRVQFGDLMRQYGVKSPRLDNLERTKVSVRTRVNKSEEEKQVLNFDQLCSSKDFKKQFPAFCRSAHLLNIYRSAPLIRKAAN